MIVFGMGKCGKGVYLEERELCKAGVSSLGKAAKGALFFHLFKGKILPCRHWRIREEKTKNGRVIFFLPKENDKADFALCGTEPKLLSAAALLRNAGCRDHFSRLILYRGHYYLWILPLTPQKLIRHLADESDCRIVTNRKALTELREQGTVILPHDAVDILGFPEKPC